MKIGLNLLIITVHPMKPGATLMSSFLFNTALVLLATNAAIQFCAQAFALYANETAIQQIWGGQVITPPCACLCMLGRAAFLCHCMCNRQSEMEISSFVLFKSLRTNHLCFEMHFIQASYYWSFCIVACRADSLDACELKLVSVVVFKPINCPLPFGTLKWRSLGPTLLLLCFSNTLSLLGPKPVFGSDADSVSQGTQVPVPPRYILVCNDGLCWSDIALPDLAWTSEMEAANFGRCICSIVSQTLSSSGWSL